MPGATAREVQPGGPEGIPPQGKARLAKTLSSPVAIGMVGYEEFGVLTDLGMEPIGLVAGVTAMHVGGVQASAVTNVKEIEEYSSAVTEGFTGALRRLREQTRLLRADGALISAVETRELDEEGGQEYSCVGTAVRWANKPGILVSRAPFVYQGPLEVLTDMVEKGCAPATPAWGICVYVVPHRMVLKEVRQSYQNSEVPQFTKGWYGARELAMGRFQGALEAEGADLSIGVRVETVPFVGGTTQFRVRGQGWVRDRGR